MYSQAPLLSARLGTKWLHALPAARLSILYCHGAAVSRSEIEKQVAFEMRALNIELVGFPRLRRRKYRVAFHNAQIRAYMLLMVFCQ